MRTFFQVLLGLLFTVVGFFGGWVGILTWTNWTYPWVTCLAGLLIIGALYLSAKEQKPRWLRFQAFGFLAGAGLLGVALSYARPLPSTYFAVIVLLLVTASWWHRHLRAIAKLFVCLFVFGWLVFCADHAALGGQVFAWKWRVIEHPVFAPGGFSRVEHHERRTIYATDTGFVDPCAEAIVWGWHVFPRVVYFGDDIPKGELLKDPKIQEVIR